MNGRVKYVNQRCMLSVLRRVPGIGHSNKYDFIAGLEMRIIHRRHNIHQTCR